jgi:hypothetical protein
MDPPVPPAVRAAADELRFRDFLTVAVVVPESQAFPDNWIYVHSPQVQVGRIQNFGTWSPAMVKPGRTCLGLEYFVFTGGKLWELPDAELVKLGTHELATLGLVNPEQVGAGYVVRMPKAYPVYHQDFRTNVEVLREWLAEHARNVHPVGRNGMHRYNNQDHSMLTAMLTVDNILGRGDHDIWSVNVEAQYQEQNDHHTVPGTGRDAPILPRRATPHKPQCGSLRAPADTHRGRIKGRLLRGWLECMASRSASQNSRVRRCAARVPIPRRAIPNWLPMRDRRGSTDG